MKLFKKALFAALLVGTLSTAAFSADAEIPDEHLKDIKSSDEQSISILCVGNSILNHGASESIGRTPQWNIRLPTASPRIRTTIPSASLPIR